MSNFKESDYYKSGKILENAKAGSILGTKKLKELKIDRIKNYKENPNKCKFCNSDLVYEKRRNVFCSSSCSATYNNSKRKKSKICDNCKKEFIPRRSTQKYCCEECSKLKQSERTKNAWKNDSYRKKISNSLKNAWTNNRSNFSSGEEHSKIIGKTTKGKYKKDIKSILEVSKRTTSKILKRLNLSCLICGWNEEICDIHHINGKKIKNCDNHSNLTYICPNCHRLVHRGKIEKNKLKNLQDTLPDNWLDLYYG